jgi:hypothetical protein
VNKDAKKKELLKDPRLEELKKLAGVSSLPHAGLTELQTRLANLKPCYALVKDDLDASPICPHGNFRPQEETLGASATAVLESIDQQLEALRHARWNNCESGSRSSWKSSGGAKELAKVRLVIEKGDANGGQG